MAVVLIPDKCQARMEMDLAGAIHERLSWI